ncbi:unnamed protein product, partial [Porites evermanni]
VLGSNFDLIFKRHTANDMVILSDGESIPTMRFFTIALFVRADSGHSSGTLFSYSVPGVPQDVIILSFTESQVKLTIKTEVVAADFKLPDNNWNYVGVVWSGTTGDVSLYINGPEIKRARNILKGDTITGGGWMVLGQEFLAGKPSSSLSTAFAGTLHQVSFWDVPATADHMWNAAHNCTWPIAGSVRAWSSFLQGIKGTVEKRFITQSLAMCATNCSHFLNCESRQGMYHCNCVPGFSGPHCNINIDECKSSPCVSGKYIDGINQYECLCNKGYWGTNCDKKVNEEKGHFCRGMGLFTSYPSTECSSLPQPSNGNISCKKLSGKELCTITCNE